MSLTSDRDQLDATIKPDGQQKDYLILSDEERSRGFVRPVRISYVHVGSPGPKYPLRDLTEEEAKRYADFGYVKYEEFPVPNPNGSSVVGSFWTQERLNKVDKGCGVKTSMLDKIAETYARQPNFYGATFCCGCGVHLPVGADGEFVWDGTSERVGT